MQQTQLQPIIVVTLYRRYLEFLNSIERIHEIKVETPVKTIVIVVWAVPEENKFGIMEKLVKEGKIDVVLERPLSEYDGWGKPTTPAELLNFDVAINYIMANYSNYYIVLQGADIIVEYGIHGWINREIPKYEAILFYWRNGLAITDAWHTNFFVVKNLQYWPKFEKKYEFDTLETMWGKRLRDEGLNQFLQSHNSRNLKFAEYHTSTPDTIYPEDYGSGVYSFVKGEFKINKFKYYLQGIKSWLKSLLNTIPWIKS